ncbi:hypothetical protein [Roseiflexus sp.]|uniref:hypothetical protein n=1 Tax=Roseiflexus sp. TaxID=2562120 RepID=UPI0021DE810C|nr:hypothetical protein [Roseiflexus sp.]GIV99604.1 MAG: hypothetical protein KatS3mg058_1008 [Roseiflexus sp.]
MRVIPSAVRSPEVRRPFMIVCALALIAALNPGVSGAQPAYTATEQRFDALSAPRAAPSATATPAPAAPSMPQSGLERAVVTSVVDGDTLDVTINRRTRRIRWIGVDTPETTHPARPVV